MFYESVQQFSFAMTAFHKILDKAEAFATDHGEILNARLAADMFPFIRQVQIFTDVAKFAAARLADRTAPTFEDNEATFADLHTRIQKATDFLNGFSAQDFQGASDRRIVLPLNKEAFLSAADYVQQYVIPNFYFHLTTAYAILRHKGVELGKRDFLGPVNFQPLNP